MSQTAPRPVALVTGASRGIGRAIATTLARANHDVVINYARNAQAAEEVAHEIRTTTNSTPHPIQADISLAQDREKLVQQTLSRFPRIDLLINNAGIAPPVRADLLDASEESFDHLLNTNLKGPYFLTQLVARQMLSQLGTGNRELGTPPQPRPKIITISSVSAYAASINRGDYCVAKAGLSMMTQLFAARLAPHGINVYEIRPGIIATDMTGPVKAKYDDLIFHNDLTPIPRWGTPDDVAKAVLALAQDLLPFSTGEVLNVDGGFHLRRL